jgi:hypothetical protein
MTEFPERPCSDFRSSQLRFVALIVLLFLLTLCVFSYRVSLTKPWFGELSTDVRSHDWLTAQTLIHATNWYDEGPAAVWFGTFWRAKTVESPTLPTRGFYCSFPPGYVVPIYVISRVLGHPPTVSLIMTYNLINHFFLAFVLAVTVLVVLMQLKVRTLVATILSVVPILLALLLPGPLYVMQAVYFSHTAVLLFFVVLALVEFWKDLSDSVSTRARLSMFQAALALGGVLTDWLCIFVVLAIYAKRVALRQLGSDWRSFVRNSAKLWLGPVLALALFALQLWCLDGFSCIWGRFTERTGGLNFASVVLDSAGPGSSPVRSFFNVFWLHRVPHNFNYFGVFLIWASTLMWIALVVAALFTGRRGKTIPREIKAALSLMGIYLLPCWGESYFLRQQCAQHEFMALKFIIPLSTIPLALLPGMLCSFFRLRQELMPQEEIGAVCGGTWTESLCLYSAVVALAIAFIYVAVEHNRYARLFFPIDHECRIVGEFVRVNTSYEDVIFSPDFSVGNGPPQCISLTRRLIHPIRSWEEICDKLSTLPGGVVVDVFVKDFTDDHLVAVHPDITAVAQEVRKAGNMRLYKIPRGIFSGKCCTREGADRHAEGHGE